MWCSLFLFPQVQCKWWIRQGGSWNREVLTSSIPLWQHQCAAHLVPPFSQGNMSTTTTPTPTMRIVPLHPGRPSMKFARLQCTSITQVIGQVRWRQYAASVVGYSHHESPPKHWWGWGWGWRWHCLFSKELRATCSVPSHLPLLSSQKIRRVG